MRILVADDHPMFRLAVREILARHYRGVEIVEAAGAPEVIEQVAKQDWALLLLDINLPGRSGLDVLRDVKAIRPELPVLMVTSYAEEQFALRAIKAGASGYLTKDAAAADLIKAVEKILTGGKFVTASVADRLVNNLQTDSQDKPAHETLSDREFHVLRALAGGKTAKEVAHDLSISIKTVSTYRTRVLEKLALKTNADLTRYALQHRLIE
jgi:DNA-binding NarL/FixJ family response regulator